MKKTKYILTIIISLALITATLIVLMDGTPVDLSSDPGTVSQQTSDWVNEFLSML